MLTVKQQRSRCLKAPEEAPCRRDRQRREVMRIATGEEEDEREARGGAAWEARRSRPREESDGGAAGGHRQEGCCETPEQALI